MHIKFTVIIQKEEKWYVAKCLENSVASQGKTIEEAIKNLKEALELYYQSEKLVEPKETYVTTVEVVLWAQNIQYYHLIKLLKPYQNFGFEKVSQKGSHVKYKNPITNSSYIIPMHSEIAKGTLKSILEQAHIDLEDFLKFL